MSKKKLAVSRGNPPKVKSVKFLRFVGGKWEQGTAFTDNGRLLVIATKTETILCPPYKVK